LTPLMMDITFLFEGQTTDFPVFLLYRYNASRALNTLLHADPPLGTEEVSPSPRRSVVTLRLQRHLYNVHYVLLFSGTICHNLCIMMILGCMKSILRVVALFFGNIKRKC
jgi:hypothetical protein